MIDERQLLERAALQVAPPDRVVDGLVRRRQRKLRNRRIGSALLAIVVAVAAFGFVLRVFERSTSRKPANPTITRDNVSQLSQVWSATTDGAVSVHPNRYAVDEPVPPTIADGVVYIGTQSGKLEAFSEDCASSCTPIWEADTGGQIFYSPTVANGYVFVATGTYTGAGWSPSGGIQAFKVGCGSDGATCRPAWVGDMRSKPLSAPVVADGFVYGIDLSYGVLRAFPISCSATDCKASWTLDLGSPDGPQKKHTRFLREIVEAPVVDGGVLYVKNIFDQAIHAIDAQTGKVLWSFAPSNVTSGVAYDWPVVDDGRVFYEGGGAVYAFDLGCRSDGTACSPLWQSSHLQGFMSQVTVSDGVVYVGLAANRAKGGAAAFSVDCAAGGRVCAPLWSATSRGEFTVTHPVVSGGAVYLTSTLNGLVEVFPTKCSDPCRQLWISEAVSLTAPVTPTFGEGVAFVGGEGGISAFTQRCQTICRPAWSHLQSGVEFSSPAVDGQTIVVSTSDARLLAFRVGAKQPQSNSSHGGAAIFYGVVALLGAGGLALRGVRRRRV